MADFLILDDDKKIGNGNNDIIIQNISFIDKINDVLISLQKIKTSEKVVFYRLLSTMTNA